MKRRDFIKLTSATGITTLITPTGIMQAMIPKPVSTLENSFLNPTNAAKPGNMWFWMNGHVTKEGITLDLEAMGRVGIGAVFNFDAGTGIPKGPLKYLSPEWFEVKAHALKECDRLGIDFCMHNCPGWSSSGGPWITPEMSMKTLTWSETTFNIVTDAQLPIGIPTESILLPKPPIKLDYYKDVVVLAFPALPPKTPPFADWEKRTNKEFNRGLKDIQEGIAIDKNTIIDLSKLMNTEGGLDFKAVVAEIKTKKLKAEDWAILRIGFTSLATENRSAPDTGIGLECDKYDTKAVEFHFNKMMTGLLPYLAPLANKGKMGLEIDSWEIGMQNWTAGFEQEFEKRNGYSLIPYLPTMTGKIVGNADTTERFLWDLRRTQADILADNYYGKMDELCNKNGITSYFEPYDRGPMEELQIGSRADSVMGEYWNGLSAIFQNNLTMRRTCKLASSIAHISGQKIVGVEGLTGEPESAKWQEYAFAMKPICDKIFTMGINRIIIHRNAHQPHPSAFPAMTMGPWGIQFDRTNTLWEVNKAWLTYLTRCQSMLQQGLFVADLAYFTGEDAGGYTKVNPDELTPSPIEGYDYDVINAEILLKKAKIVNNRLVLPDGMSYKVLVLQDYKTMSLDLLKRLKEFVQQGLVIIGKKPETTAGLKTHSPEAITEFTSISTEIWGNDALKTDRQIGKGRVFWGSSLAEILKTIDLKPDFEASSRSGDAPIKYFHRNTEGEDFYFVCNQRRTQEEVVCTFRVKGKIPELWDANTGKIKYAPVFEEVGDRTNVSFRLDPYGSVFVVFRKETTSKGYKTITKDNTVVMSAQPLKPAQVLNYQDVINNFSYTFWAKPELNIMLSTKAFYEAVTHPWTDFYAIYPLSGEKLYGKTHATSGVTVGRNGIAIWENANGTPVFNMAAVTPISGWSHISIVYTEGVPSVYVNGNFIAKGEKKHAVIHPSGKAFLSDGASYYNGDMTEPIVHKEALKEPKIKELSKILSPKTIDINRALEPYSYRDLSSVFLIWQNGTYVFTANNGLWSKLPFNGIAKPVVLNGAWDVHFPSKMGAPDKISLPYLSSLKNHVENGVKYFSGTASYRKNFTLTKSAFSVEKRLFIDLGQVEVIAEVFLNGKNLGIYWTRPYLIDITEAAKMGENQLEVKVTNQWVNRLIGDAQLPDLYKYSTKGEGTTFAPLEVGAIEELPDWYKKGEPKPDDGRVTFTTWKHHKKDSPLLESGLIGPVVLREAMIKAS
jgi:hypothetical protein